MNSSLNLSVILFGMLFLSASLSKAQRFSPGAPLPSQPSMTQAARSQTGAMYSRIVELRGLVTTHLNRNGQRVTEAEADLKASLIELVQEATNLRQLVQGTPLYRNIYRRFHLVEYWLNDSWGLAVESGYSQSLAPYFQQIGNDLETLGNWGLRNPRVEPLSPSRNYGSFTSNRPFRSPRPSQYPSHSPSGPILERDPAPFDNQPDLGDFFRGLFNRGR